MSMIAEERLAWRTFDEFSLLELHDVFRLRCRVFIVEQQCHYADVDGLDPDALHLLAWSPGVTGLSGYLRLLHDETGPVRIGRVVTAPEARSGGLGKRLMIEALDICARRFGSAPVELSAQAHLEHFYESVGFARISNSYLEDGIEHCDMRLKSLLI